jgi:putative multiple sugar transport system permease protein
MDKKKTVNINMKEYGMILALIAVFLIFSVMTGGKNMSPANINNLIMQNSYIVILAVGMLLCVLTGNIDLGVGSIVAVCGAVVGIMIVDYNASIWVAIPAAILIGTLSGMFVGFFVSKLSIPPFIVTLATMLMARGLTYTLLKAQTKGPLPADYTFIGAGFIPTMKISVGGGTIDLISIGVALIAFILIILFEIKSIKTKRNMGFQSILCGKPQSRSVLSFSLSGSSFISFPDTMEFPSF